MMLKMIKKVRSTSFQKFVVLTTSVLAFGTIAHAAPIELTMQHMEQPPSRVEAMQVVVDKFNEKYPEYRMKQNVVGWGEAFTRVPAQIEAGVGVDLQQAIPGFFVYVISPAAATDADLALSKFTFTGSIGPEDIP